MKKIIAPPHPGKTFLYAPYADPDDASQTSVVVIDESVWRSEGRWDDEDPFEDLAQAFGLHRLTECEYEPSAQDAETVRAALAKLAADPRFTLDASILAI